ncbi:hypothetical protein EII29_01280 [Leptotrichia sp. OH3620_COT-345]|uniref:hypothetical protein n=1 Tax=Leptotrichia sp. OH3620_COT-345 TaxID=2491048 RepID=UPI000F64CABB|nr:hypothetical protein [Leptotrichia sp. OH3620_COT-345]RRD40603.1 hypothetical protein EII29_01280 [Leptotrichia sp. OH3620_COT-345]
MKEYGETFIDRVLTNDEIRKLQEEKIEDRGKRKKFTDGSLHNIGKKYRKNIKVKESDYRNINEKLNNIYRKYYEKIQEGEITTLEEFYDMIMIAFVLYEHLEKVNFTEKTESNNKLLEFKNKIRKYNELKAERKNYNKYNKKYATDIETKQYEAEIRRIDAQTDTVRKEMTQFVNVLLSELWEDYGKFKSFIRKEENLVILGELAELNSSFEELDEVNIFENSIDIRNKLENYLEEIEQFDFHINEKNDTNNSIENILNAFRKENDIINLMRHFTYANILIRNNIMKFPLISQEYKENSNIMQEIKFLKYEILSHHRNSLTYRDNVKIDDEMMENYSDPLFYDLLYLQYNRENEDKKSFLTFENLDSTERNYKTDLKTDNPGIIISGDKVTLNCNINDFIQISNALELIEKLKEEDTQKDFLTFLYKDEGYYENRKFKLKSKFMSERENVLRRIEKVSEIEKELIIKRMRLISTERKFIFTLLEKTENETEDFKLIMIKLLKEPFFIKKIIKAENIEKNRGYQELYRKITGGEKNGKKTL